MALHHVAPGWDKTYVVPFLMAEDISIVVACWSCTWYIFRVALTAAARTLVGGAILLAHACINTPSRRPRHRGI